MRGTRSAIGILALVALLAMTSVGVAAKAFPTKYTGTTSQGERMSLVVGPSGRAVTIDMNYRFTCPAANKVLSTGDTWRAYLSTTRKFRNAWSTTSRRTSPTSRTSGRGT